MSADASALYLVQLGGTGPVPLTPREEEVLSQLAHGKTDRQIAAQLSLSDKTVGHHVENILAKLDARNRTHAVALALTRGLIRLA